MLSNFIRRSGKRKGNKANGSHSRQRSLLVSPLPEPPLVFNINEESLTPPSQNSRLVELNLSDSNEEWFPQELLQRKSLPGSPSLPAHDVVVVRDDVSPSLGPSPSHAETIFPSSASRKKSIPAPIFIPGVHLTPNVQKGRPSGNPLPQIPLPNTNDTSLSPESDSLSAISGTTLARALIASSFVLSTNEHRSSRHRSGIVRQDSATLPRRESFFLSDSGKSSPIPPVPPVPAKLATVSLSPSHPKSGASTESEYPASDSYMTSPEGAIGAAIPRRISRIQHFPSPVTSTSPLSSGPEISPQQRCPGSTRQRVFNHTMFDVPKTAFPINFQEAAQYSSQDGSSLLTPEDHSLDEFDFMPPEPLTVIASPDSDSNASRIKPLPKRGDLTQGQRKRRVGELNLVQKDSKGDSSADGILASRQSCALPSTTVSEHDYGELLNYDLTVSPGTSSSGYQTFPETPMIFSPLWSPGYALLSKSDSQMLRKGSSTPKSARLGPGRLYSNVKTARRQLSINEGIRSTVVLRRCRSSLSPIQRTPSPKRAKWTLSPFEQTNDETGFLDEAIQASTAKSAESQNSVEYPSVIRPHPLSHISSSSSCLPEEEALQALAPHSASPLPSIVVGDGEALLKPGTVSPFVESPDAVPLPESINESPFNSPASADNVPAASSSPSPLLSPHPTTTTTTSPSDHSICPLSAAPSTSLGGVSFLPSPSSPIPRSLSPMPFVPSTVVPDELDSHSPSLSFVPPPPYHAVVSERTAHHPGSSPTPPLSRTPSFEPFQHSRQASNSSLASSSFRVRVRARPPLPIGPRKQSGPVDSFAPRAQGRNGSIFSLASVDNTGNQGTLWRKLQSAASKPPLKFQAPPPKWRGLTLEASQWTFTSEQLQEVVSRAIQQSSEGSSLRLLRLEVLEGEIADETHRLELQHTDVKAQYKALARKRWTLMGALVCHIEGVETNDGVTASRTMEELTEVLLTLDQLADKMHSIALQLAQLKSLRDIHNASALALVVRKINGLFVRQMAEKERLQEQVDALQTERDEAWKQAENIAQDYDTLSDRMSVSMGARTSADARSSAGSNSKRSTHISAVRKSSVRQSQAGLRPRSKHRSSRPPSSGTRPASLALVDVPPLPRLPSIESATLFIPTDISLGAMHSNSSATSEALALAEAQREVYEMLGLSLPPSQASSRRRTMSAGPESSENSSLRLSSLSSAASSRPVSASFGAGAGAGITGKRTWSREEWRRAFKSVVLDDASLRHRLPVPPLRVTNHG